MIIPVKSKPFAAVFILLFMAQQSVAQGSHTDYDSTLFVKDTARPVIKRFQNLQFSGYIQPQFQVAEEKAIDSYEGGSFPKNSDNRFMLRRARLKTEYTILSNGSPVKKKGSFVLQLEATERGVNVIDAFARWIIFPQVSVTAGLFDHPFGNEVLMSSSAIESPERGRASQVLLPAEKDLGAMVSFEPAGKVSKFFRLDAGFFNGQGTAGPRDFDSFKDLNARLRMKPLQVSPAMFIGGGISALYGGWVQENRHRYELSSVQGTKIFISDSNLTNVGRKVPREYLDSTRN
jgi:hypothetical protein